MNSDFRSFIKRTRLEKGLTQKEVAEKIGVSQQAYSKFENSSGSLSFNTIKKLSCALDIPQPVIASIVFDSTYQTDFELHEQIEGALFGEKKQDHFQSLLEMVIDSLKNLNQDGIREVINYARILSYVPCYKREKEK